MKRWARRFVILVLFIVLIGGSAAAYLHAGKEPEVNFRTAPVTRQDLIVKIGATGTIEPEEVVDVGAQVAGQILKFGTDKNGKTVDYGSQIEANTLLAQIDDSLYQADVATAKATLAQANAGVVRGEADLQQNKSKLEEATADWKRAQELPKGALASTQYDQYKAVYDQAVAAVGVSAASLEQDKANVIVSQANLDRAQRNLGYTVITSPVKGVIIDRRVNIGQTVVSSLNAPSLFLIAKDLTKMQIWVPVNEADIGNIHSGQLVTFTVDAFPGKSFKGTVVKVRLNASMTQNVVTYTVEVETDNSDNALLPYLSADVSFQVAKHDNVLTVPNAALRYTPDANEVDPSTRDQQQQQQQGGETSQHQYHGPTTRKSKKDSEANRPHFGTVWIQDDRFLKPVHVKLGLANDAETEVISDELNENTQVVIGEVHASADSGATKNPFAPSFGSRRGH